MSQKVLLWALAVHTCCSSPVPPPNPDKLLPKYEINLDLEPEHRYMSLIHEHKTYIREILATVMVLFGNSKVAKDLINTVQIPEEYKREIQGIADAAEVPYLHALTANMYYEVSGVSGIEWNTTSQSCTSIAAQNSNGTVYLARNQDYPKLFGPLLFDAIYTRKGKEVYRGTSFAGTVGLATGFVKGAFGVSINARGNFRPNEDIAHKQCAKGALFFPLLTRMAADHAITAREAGRNFTYQDAINYFVETDLIMPGYVIVSGTNNGEGAIITRNFTGGTRHNDIFSLFSKKDDAGAMGQGTWFVVQTNDDHWKLPTDPRRGSAIRSMEKITQNRADFDGLWEVLNTAPVFNDNTIHTDLVDVKTGDYRTYLQHTV